MRKYLLILVACGAFVACRKTEKHLPPLPPPPPAPAVLLKDVVHEHLPSPYYHFEYDSSKRVSFVSFASDFTRYDVFYDGNRISEMRNNTIANKDRLQYVGYNDAGQVGLIKYANSTGLIYKIVELFYEGPKLVKVDRSRRVNAGFVLEKSITMSYYADGNLSDISYHLTPFEGQTESTYTEHFEQYDNKINVDGYDLIHNEFFDHFFLLPGVQLQKNNPGKETLTGVTDSYTINYTYTYNDKNAPLTRNGDLVFLTGTRIGQHLNFSSTYSYYP